MFLTNQHIMSPDNSMCFMDRGIDLALSRIVMPRIESTVKKQLKIMEN